MVFQMKVLDDLIASLEHDAPVQEVRTCVFWTAVITRHCGLASTLRDESLPHGHSRVRDVGHLLSKSGLELAQYARSDNPLEASIGMAAINSLLDIDESRCVELNAADLLIERGRGRKVALIGHFPFIRWLREAVGTLWVIEKRPHGNELPAQAAAQVLPQADVVAITGTTLINHTFESLVALCRPESFVVLLGPSAPLSPVLFDYGVDVISGTQVVDPLAVLRCISQGATFRQVEGVRLLTMAKERG